MRSAASDILDQQQTAKSLELLKSLIKELVIIIIGGSGTLHSANQGAAKSTKTRKNSEVKSFFGTQLKLK